MEATHKPMNCNPHKKEKFINSDYKSLYPSIGNQQKEEKEEDQKG
jgi:hypothetical protein